MRILKLVVFFLVFFLGLTEPTFAQTLPAGRQVLPKVEKWEVEENLTRLSPVRFLPDHPLYFFISLKETIDYFRQRDKVKKALFDVHLAGKKIKETYLLVQKNNLEKATNSLKNYQRVSQRLGTELTEAINSGLPAITAAKVLSEDLERHLAIIIFLSYQSSEAEFRQELSDSVKTLKTTAKLLEKHFPGAAQRIESLANQSQISQ